MTETKNLFKKEAVKKMQEMVDNNHTALMFTNLSQQPLSTRPMFTQEVDKEGNFWFMSDSEGEHNSHIESDPKVQLSYANEGKSEYLSVYGKAIISRDKNKIDDFWSPMAKAWFDDKNDPRITIVKVIPEDSFYWDTKHYKFVSLLKIATSALSDKKMDDGVSGSLNTNV